MAVNVIYRKIRIGYLRMYVMGWMLGWSGYSYAQEPITWQTEEFVRKAKSAMALGLLDAWKQALDQAEAAHKKESSNMPLARRHNARLWIWLLWSRYYRVKGELPPILGTQKMEDKKALEQYIQKFEQALKALQESRDYLQQYTQLFGKIMERARWQDQIYLQAAMSVLRDTNGDIRSGQIYVVFLQYALQHWGNQKKIARRFEKLGALVSRLAKSREAAKVQSMLQQDRQRRVAHVMMDSQRNYVATYQDNLRRKRVGTGFLIAGSIVAVLGGAALIGGAVLLAEGQQSNSPWTAGEKQQRNDTGLGLAIGGGVVLAGGGIWAVVGALMRPPPEAMERSTIQNHNKPLEWEREHPLPRTSFRYAPYKENSVARFSPCYDKIAKDAVVARCFAVFCGEGGCSMQKP